MLTIRKYSDGVVSTISADELRLFPYDSIPEGVLLWIDLSAPTEEENQAILHWHLVHELVAADMSRATDLAEAETQPHYPKVEEFDGYLFIIFHALDSKATPRQVNFIIGESFLITHHAGAVDAVERVGLPNTFGMRAMQRGPDYLLHVLLDEIVDDYLSVVEGLEDKIDELENYVLGKPTQLALGRLLRLKRKLVDLRRTMVYEREIAVRLARGEFDLVSDEEALYYRNVYDHLVRLVDHIESLREAAVGAMDAYFSASNARLNQVIKILTVISTIFLPLTFIAGVYGMNFDVMPELRWEYGYFVIMAFMIALGLSMFFFMRKRGWLE
jgi:magnesium transporter